MADGRPGVRVKPFEFTSNGGRGNALSRLVKSPRRTFYEVINTGGSGYQDNRYGLEKIGMSGRHCSHLIEDILEQAISRVLFSRSSHLFGNNGHSSSLNVTIEIKRPTRELERTTLKRSLIWSCSEWGLPSSCRRRQDW
jgi:hypothetical protein